MSFINEIKCSQCGRWNHWSNRIFDVCFFCGEFLDLQSIYKASKDEELVSIRESTSILIIRKEDKWPVIWIKRIFAVVNILFIALLSFIVFLISITPG